MKMADEVNVSADEAEDKVLDEMFDVGETTEEPETSPKSDDLGEDVPEEETEEEKPEPEAKEEEEEENPEDVDDEPILGRPSVKDINAKFPELFKTFPELRHSYFREIEFTKIFPTVDAARDAADRASIFNTLEDTLDAGDPSLLVNALSRNKESLNTFAHQILPQIANVAPEVFRAVNSRFLRGILRTVAEEAQVGNNRNLYNSVVQISNFLFKEAKVPDAPDAMPEPQRREQSVDPRFKEYHAEVAETMTSELDKLIESNVPKNITGLARKTAVNEIRERLRNTLAKDDDYRRRINGLWDQVEKRGFSRHDRPRLVAAFLGRVKSLIPHVRGKVLADVGSEQTKTKPRVIPSSSVAPKGQRIDPRKVDFSKTSDDDILDGKINLKR